MRKKQVLYPVIALLVTAAIAVTPIFFVDTVTAGPDEITLGLVINAIYEDSGAYCRTNYQHFIVNRPTAHYNAFHILGHVPHPVHNTTVIPPVQVVNNQFTVPCCDGRSSC